MLVLLFVALLSAKTPVLLVPGLCGSQIQYRNFDWDSWGYLWLNSARTIPILKNLYIQDLQVKYSPSDDTYKSNVSQTRPYSFGTVDGIDHIDSILVDETHYYHTLIQALEAAGYSNGKDLVGAPFDFRVTTYRQAPTTFFPDLQKLIETTVNNNGAPILVVTHSLASPVVRHFLANFVTADWKQQYIRGWVSGFGAFAGGPEALHLLCSYKVYLVPTFSGEDMNNVDSFFAGLFWLLPTTFGYSNDTVLLNVTLTDADSFVVTVGNISEAFSRGIGASHATAAQNFLNLLNSEFTPPNVETWLYYGTGSNTIISENFTGASSSWWKQDGAENYVDGDDLVPTTVALAPQQWDTTFPVHWVEKPGQSHLGILEDNDWIADIVNIATGNTGNEAALSNGLYAQGRAYAKAVHTVAKEKEHAFALRLAEVHTNIRKLYGAAKEALGGKMVGVEEQIEQLGAEAWEAIVKAIAPMNNATAAGESRLQALAAHLLKQYGTTKDLTTETSTGSLIAPASPLSAEAAEKSAKLAERDGQFAAVGEKMTQRLLQKVNSAMAEANRAVDELEKKALKVLAV